METVTKKLYEGMFLVDSAEAAADWEGVNEAIKNILEKAGAEILAIKKWDERRLAYEIKGKGRGTYILSYFRLDGPKVQEIERSVQLSEKLMRVLILNAEDMDQNHIEKETPAMIVEKIRRQEQTDKESKSEKSQEPADADLQQQKSAE